MNTRSRIASVILALSLIAGMALGFPGDDPAASGSAVAANPQAKTAEPQNAPPELITRKFILRYASPKDVLDKAAFLNVRGTILTDDAIMVSIWKRDLPAFEELLKTMDVEKYVIQVQIVPILAARDALKDMGEETDLRNLNKGLSSVLDEMKSLWSFRHFWVEAPSFLTVGESSGYSGVNLVSKENFVVMIKNPELRGETPGRRIVRFGEVVLRQNAGFPNESSLFNTQAVEIRENGYLVAGVGGMRGGDGRAVILVINAVVKSGPAAALKSE